MQALLETMCIPTGMELFPAASEEQLTLIKRVIDDCDYYVVVVAGRYGSLGSGGKSYTEIEFDYALASGKSVIAFYHADIETLPGARLEKSDSGRQRLAQFIAKIKEARVCKSWSTPEGLASAIKSAILHAIVNDRKPGWVRAADFASPSAIEKLKESITRPANRRSTTSSSWANECVEFPARIGYYEVDNPADYRVAWADRKYVLHVFRPTWGSLFLLIGQRLTVKGPRRTLKMFLEERMVEEAGRTIRCQPDKHAVKCSCALDDNVFDRILDTFVAQKLVKIVRPPKDVGTQVAYWEITAKGQQWLAELRTATP